MAWRASLPPVLSGHCKSVMHLGCAVRVASPVGGLQQATGGLMLDWKPSLPPVTLGVCGHVSVATGLIGVHLPWLTDATLLAKSNVLCP